MPEGFHLSASDAEANGPLRAGPYPGAPHPAQPHPGGSPDINAAGSLAAIVAAGGERVLWSGQCAVAEYAFEEPASLPRWTLPEGTEVVVTEQRVVYRDQATTDTGELHWPWPQHLRVQPGNRDTGRAATVTQIQLVCAGPAETFPALVFAGGDLSTVGDADRFANLLRQAIARYRVENASDLGLTAPQTRMLSRLLIGPEFRNYQGGDGQTVSLLGALPVQDEPLTAAPYPVAGYAEQVAPASYPPAGYAEAVSAVPYVDPASAPPRYDAPTSYAAAAPPAAPEPADAPYGGSAPYAASESTSPYVVPAPYVLPSAYVPEPYVVPSVHPAPEPYRLGGSGAPRPSIPPARSVSPAAAPPQPGPDAASTYPRPAAVPAQSGPDAASTYPRPAAAPAQPGPDAASAGPAARDARAAGLAGAGSAAGRPLPEPTDLESRAADLAARVAMLVSGGAEGDRPSTPSESPTTKLSAYLNPDESRREQEAAPREPRTSADSLSRAEAVRLTAARMVGNTARLRGTPPQRQADDEISAAARRARRT